jgi:hypothetical protein
METNEIDYDDVSLDDPTSIDDVIDTGKEPVNPDPKPVNPEPEPEPKKQRGRPKSTPEPTPEPTPDPTPEPEPDTTIEENFINSIAKKIGIELGEDEEYEDSEDGLVAFTQRAAEDIADSKLNDYFSSLPPIAGDFFDYLQMLGEEATEDKIKSFFTTVNPEINYSEVDLDNEMTQKAVLKSFYKKNDYTDEEITKKLDKFEIAGMLKEEAEDAANKLSKLQVKERETLLKQEKAEAEARKEKTQKFFGNIKQVLESGKVNNFTVPVTEKKAIFDYDVQGGFMKDLNEILKDPTKRVELAIAVKNKFNLSKYVQQAAATQKANALSAKIKASVGTGKGTANPNLVANSGIDWDKI